LENKASVGLRCQSQFALPYFKQFLMISEVFSTEELPVK